MLTNSFSMCLLVLALCFYASIATQNLAALLMPISDGLQLIILKFWGQWIVDLIILVHHKPKLVLPASTVLSDNHLSRMIISESSNVRIS